MMTRADLDLRELRIGLERRLAEAAASVMSLHRERPRSEDLAEARADLREAVANLEAYLTAMGEPPFDAPLATPAAAHGEVVWSPIAQGLCEAPRGLAH